MRASIRDTLLDLFANYAIMTVLEMDTPDESHATLYAYDKKLSVLLGRISKMKAKESALYACEILLVVAMMLMFLTGCNRRVIDTTFSYDNAILVLPLMAPVVRQENRELERLVMTAIRFR